MENEGMKLVQPRHDVTNQHGDMYLTIKRGCSNETVYHNIINQLEWLSVRNGNNPQQILEWLQQKKFFTEHVYKPVV